MLFILNLRKLTVTSLSIAIVGLLSACGGNSKPQSASPSKPDDKTALAQKVVVEAETAPAISQESKKLTKLDLTNQLLYEAEVALSKDQLTTPAYENAYDKYQAALLVDPSNSEAKSGIQKVVNRYCQLANQSADAYHFEQASVFLAKARQILPNSLSVRESQDYLAKAKRVSKQVEPEPNVQVVVTQDNEIDLPRQSLRTRSDVLSQQLAELAQKVKKNDQFVLIVTPTDAEGRWVYAQMKEALPGYRLRGDIRLGKEPKIILQAPIN
ncbi:hypothetical protein MAH4_20970 [Sessilibacter sp. MAH4]